MLHSVNKPDCAELLQKVAELQCRIIICLCMLADSDNGWAGPLSDVETWNRVFGEFGPNDLLNTQAKWVRDRYVLYAPNTFQCLVKSLHDWLGDTTRVEIRKKILEVAGNDSRLEHHHGNSDYRLQSVDLQKEIEDLFPAKKKPQEATALKDLMVYFYEGYFNSSGFGKEIHGASDIILTRNYYIERWKKANPELRVCPYCDLIQGQTPLDEWDPNTVGPDAPFHLDHFLPKSLYFFLSLHPDNLVPICSWCNMKDVKGDLDPLASDAGSVPELDSLTQVFLPYSTPLYNNTYIRVRRSTGLKITIEEKFPPTGISPRIKRVSDFLKIPARWINQLVAEQILVMDEVKGAISTFYREDTPISDDLLKAFLENRLETTIKRIGNIPGQIVRKSYLEFLTEDTTERRILLEKVSPSPRRGPVPLDETD